MVRLIFFYLLMAKKFPKHRMLKKNISGGHGKVKRMIKVLIVDDSAVMRKILTEELSKYNDIEIIGTAVDPICKPGSAYAARDISRRLVHAIRAAASSRIVGLEQSATAPAIGQLKNIHVQTADKAIAIGASTGAPKAIETVLMSLPENTPGIVIVQHMPANFTHAYAARLNKMCPLEVREAKDYDHVRPGEALIP